MSNIIRNISIEDYDRGYMNLLSQLTDTEGITKKMFEETFVKMPSNQKIYIIENKKHELLASGTLVIEQKFIHGCKSVGHIEDIIVNDEFRGKGLGKAIVDHLVKKSKEFGCYKCILNCSDDLIRFYNKSDFQRTGNEMSIYFE